KMRLMSMAMPFLRWLTERLSDLRSFYWHCGTATRQRLPQRASLRHRPPTAVAGQQLLRPPGQHAPDLSALPPDPGDHRAVVAGGLVAHPGDDGGFGPLLDGDALRPGHGPAPYRRGV